MDVYLSRDTLRELEALRILAGGGEGILRGHRRGQRFFVENILPISRAVSASSAKLRQIQDVFPETFLGFFCTNPGPAKKNKVLIPQIVGKVFLELKSREAKEPVWQAYLIDYDGTFRLVPLKILKAPLDGGRR